MTRLPPVATIVVALAVAAMFGLGVWQVQRAGEKRELIASYRAASGQSPMAWPAQPGRHQALLYRRATGFCTDVTGWRAVAGRNRAGRPGWSHVAGCRTGGLEGPGMQVDMGWSLDHRAPAWRGGAVSGVIAPDRLHGIRLVSGEAAPGLEPSAAPNPEDLPNNHVLYAGQWFFFALAALVIYVLALRGRRKVAEGAPNA